MSLTSPGVSRVLDHGPGSGTLKNSGRVDRPEKRGAEVTVKLKYGGAAIPYALIQHERTDYHHTRGQAKYPMPTTSSQST